MYRPHRSTSTCHTSSSDWLRKRVIERLRSRAVWRPRGFLRQHPGPVILDEVQRAPDIFPYLQEAVDRDPAPGRFILTGSEHFGLSEGLSQSLAGRVALLNLFPLSLEELSGEGELPDDPWRCVWTGGYPRIHDHELDPARWLADYTSTYVQRDVRQVLEVTDLHAFSAFPRLAAGRTAQELNLSGLGADAGISHNTARSWLSVLEASFVLFTAPPWLRNVRRRATKAPKLHFVDSGLACHLLGIRKPGQLTTHPLRDPVFESWAASEILKRRLIRGLPADLFHLRESRGLAIDLLVEGGRALTAVEVKSGQTVGSDFFPALRAFQERMEEDAGHRTLQPRLVFAGDARQRRTSVDVIPWHQLHEVDWD